MANLADKAAIVTGASREIGAAMAEALAAQGCAVLLAHYGEPERAEATVAAIRAAGGRCERYEGDLSTVAGAYALVARAVELFCRLDILAANAGLTIGAPLIDTDEATFDTLFDLNVKGSFFCAQAAARQMAAHGGGRIVFSSSVTGVQACRNLGAYGITKAALRHMARVWALELGPLGITVNALGIGATLNERNLRDDPEYEEHWGAITPVGRVARPSDAAGALLFLVSDAAATVTGHTLLIDGGWTIASPMPA